MTILSSKVACACVLSFALAGATAHAQQVSPTIAEFTRKARGTVDVTNISKEAKVVSCAAHGFDADEHGAAHARALDSGLNVRLSTGRVELPPGAVRQISFDALPSTLPAWFLVSCRFVPLQPAAGLTLALEVSSIVVIHDKDFNAEQVAFKARHVDGKVELEVTNNGAGMARVDASEVTGRRAKADLGTFLLYPHQRRLVQAEWKQSSPPEAARIQIGKKRLETVVE